MHLTWSGIPQIVINEAIDGCVLRVKRLRACVKAKGRHFEHSLEPTGSCQRHLHIIEKMAMPLYAYAYFKIFC